MFELAENALLVHKHSEQSKQVFGKLKSSKEYLVKAGYDLIGVEDFYDMVIEAFEVDSFDDFIEKFTTEYISDALICYIRLITAAKLKEVL